MIKYHSQPERFIGKGSVWIAWDEQRHTYYGYWDLEPDGKPTPLEPAPESGSLDELLTWARERAGRVFVRPMVDPHAYYWAGEGPIPEDAAQQGMKRLGLT